VRNGLPQEADQGLQCGEFAEIESIIRKTVAADPSGYGFMLGKLLFYGQG
jgi:hypothetical protein